MAVYKTTLCIQVGLVGDNGDVVMVSEVADEEKEALEAAVLKEEAKDKEAEASKDYTGLIPEVRSTNATTTIITTTPSTPLHHQVYKTTASALLGELEEDSVALEVKIY